MDKDKLKDRIVYALTLAIIFAFNIIPAKLAFFFGEILGVLLFFADKKHRFRALENLRLSFPEKSEKEIKVIAKRVFKNLGLTAAEVAKAFGQVNNKENSDCGVSFEGVEHVLNAQKKGKGILLMTAHFGNWELGAIGFSSRFPFNFVVRPIDNPYIDSLSRKLRGKNGSGIISKKNGLREILKSLKKNETVGILMDQNVLEEEGVFVNFFDRIAATTPVVSLVALRTGASVLPAFAVRQAPGKIKIVIKEEVKIEPTGDTKADILKYTQIFSNIIESVIKEYPDQWFWVHNRWKTKPSN